MTVALRHRKESSTRARVNNRADKNRPNPNALLAWYDRHRADFAVARTQR